MIFIKGLVLSELLFKEIVSPIISKCCPELKYAAALLGKGSEVLGLDDETSTDHNWGPRLQLFLKESDYNAVGPTLKEKFSQDLPTSFKGYSTNWSRPDKFKNQFLQAAIEKKINHRIEIWTIEQYLQQYLGIASLNLTEKEWLLLSEQGLLEFTSGKVFFDSLGELTAIRKKLSYYPEGVWYFILLSEWMHVSEELPFVGRTGSRGDELGSKIIAIRLVHRIMRISFIISKSYIPYNKWIGTLFKRLSISKSVESLLIRIINTNDWREMEENLCNAALLLIKEEMKLNIVPTVHASKTKFFNREQWTVNLDDMIIELKKRIPASLSAIPYSIGSINQFVDDANILTDPEFTKRLFNLKAL